jgi:hypothetical protein
MSGREVQNPHQLAEDMVRTPEIVLAFYHLMHLSAKSAVADITQLASTHDMVYELLPMEMEGILRRVPERGNTRAPYYSTEYSLEYNPDDIYVYGGCALSLYDNAMHGFKEKHRLNALEKRVLKHTTDIDLTWFPRVPDVITGWVATANSPIIMALAEQCKIRLKRILTVHQGELQTLIIGKLRGQHKVTEVNQFNVHHHYNEHGKKAGVHAIKISFKVNGVELQLCELSIHDSASSQLYDENHRIINVMRPMTEDPIYCPPNELVHLDVLHGKKIPVPNVELYCKQQLFIFSNKLNDHQYQKALTSFRRVTFFLYLLEALSHPHNANEKTKVKTHFGIKNIRRTIADIHEMIDYVKIVFTNEIAPLCSGRSNDEALMMLCSPAKELKGQLSYSMYPRSKAADMRFMRHDEAYQMLPVLSKRIDVLINLIERTAQSNRSINLSGLLEDAIQIENRIGDEIKTPAENYRNLDETIAKLNREIDILYAKYQAVMQRPPASRAKAPSASRATAPSASLSAAASSFVPSSGRPPLPRPMSQTRSANHSMHKSSNKPLNKPNNNSTRKKSNKN